jgi:lipoate-protein ligase A
MVTAAIRERNLRARVNERHDIVLDQGPMLEEKDWPDPTDMHQTKFQREDGKTSSLKISGSAYKITRQRALHHGTCLLASANLRSISDYLKSPARQFIKARGVESVRSPIGNVHHEPEISSMSYNKGFQAQVINRFMDMYGISERANPIVLGEKLRGESIRSSGNEWTSGWVDQELEGITEIRDGIEEMKVSQAGN